MTEQQKEQKVKELLINIIEDVKKNYTNHYEGIKKYRNLVRKLFLKYRYEEPNNPMKEVYLMLENKLHMILISVTDVEGIDVLGDDYDMLFSFKISDIKDKIEFDNLTSEKLIQIIISDKEYCIEKYFYAIEEIQDDFKWELDMSREKRFSDYVEVCKETLSSLSELIC